MIRIEKQEYEIPLATKSGWITPIGLIGEIDGVKVSYVLIPNRPIELAISELTSESRAATYQLSREEVLACDTQEKTIILFRAYSLRLAASFARTKNIDDYIERAKAKITKLIGKMPELKETSV